MSESNQNNEINYQNYQDIVDKPKNPEENQVQPEQNPENIEQINNTAAQPLINSCQPPKNNNNQQNQNQYKIKIIMFLNLFKIFINHHYNQIFIIRLQTNNYQILRLNLDFNNQICRQVCILLCSQFF